MHFVQNTNFPLNYELNQTGFLSFSSASIIKTKLDIKHFSSIFIFQRQINQDIVISQWHWWLCSLYNSSVSLFFSHLWTMKLEITGHKHLFWCKLDCSRVFLTNVIVLTNLKAHNVFFSNAHCHTVTDDVPGPGRIKRQGTVRSNWPRICT